MDGVQKIHSATRRARNWHVGQRLLMLHEVLPQLSPRGVLNQFLSCSFIFCPLKGFILHSSSNYCTGRSGGYKHTHTIRATTRDETARIASEATEPNINPIEEEEEKEPPPSVHSFVYYNYYRLRGFGRRLKNSKQNEVISQLALLRLLPQPPSEHDSVQLQIYLSIQLVAEEEFRGGGRLLLNRKKQEANGEDFFSVFHIFPAAGRQRETECGE